MRALRRVQKEIMSRHPEQGLGHSRCAGNVYQMEVLPKVGNGPRGPLADERINKTGSIHTADYSSALKRKAVLTHTWMNLGNMMLSERSQTPKASYCIVSFT